MFPNMHLCDVLKRKIYIVSEEQFPEDCEIMITQWLFEVIFHHLQQKYVIRFLRRKKSLAPIYLYRHYRSNEEKEDSLAKKI